MNFEKALFEATAWILLARLNYIVTESGWHKLIARGDWGSEEISPSWLEQ